MTSLDRVRVRASALAVGGSTEVRRATEADSAAIYDVHNREAARCNGRIARVGPLFAEPPTLRVSGVTVAKRDHQIVGYVSWSRGRGYGATGELVVNQLIGDDADSLRSLLSFVARFDSVTPHIVFSTSGIAPWQHLLATAHPEPVSSAPYALAVLDPIALTQTTLSDSLNCRLPFRIHQPGGKVDDRVLVVEAGQSSLEAGDDSGRSFTPGGLALTFAGAHTSASLRANGYVSGDDADDSTWDALMCRSPVTVDTYF